MGEFEIIGQKPDIGAGEAIYSLADSGNTQSIDVRVLNGGQNVSPLAEATIFRANTETRSVESEIRPPVTDRLELGRHLADFAKYAAGVLHIREG